MTGVQPSQLTIDSYEIFSKEHLNLVLKGKYSGGFGKVEAGFNFDNTNIKSRFILDVTQVYYSIDVNSISPDGFFTKKPDNISNLSPVYVGSIKYGRKILVAVETTQNLQDQAFNLKTEFGVLSESGSIEANSLLQKLLNESSIKLLVMGGNPENAFDAFKAISNKQDLFEILRRDAILSPQTKGIPLAYSLRHATDNSIFNLSQFGEFVARRCKIKPIGEVDIALSSQSRLCPTHTGGDREFGGNGPNTEFSVKIFNVENNIFANVRCVWTEDGGDGTQGVFNKDILVGVVPPELKLLEITSPKETIWNYKDNNGHAAEGNSFRQEGSPVKLVSIMGDTGDDDDLSFDCGIFMNTGILNLEFYPLKVRVRKRK